MATIRSSGASQSTIKLVATNLIASGKLAGELYCAVYCVLFRNHVHLGPGEGGRMKVRILVL